MFNVQKVAAGLYEHCDCTKQTLCSISLCDANLCLVLHNSGCQMPEGPDYLLPVIILSLIDPLMQNVQNQFGFFPLSLSWANWMKAMCSVQNKVTGCCSACSHLFDLFLSKWILA